MIDENMTLGRIADVLAATFPSATAAMITRKTTSADIDGWDSLSYSILIMNVEDAFDIELPIERIYDLADIGSLCDLVAAQLRSSS